jgi:L-threonylcarbamoyladenylate synthase
MKNEHIEKEVKRAVEVLEAGGIILYPTDTVWGIGCDATNPEAVRKVYEIKRRDDSKSLIVLLDSFTAIDNYIDNFNKQQTIKILNDSEKPTTIIYQKAKNLAENLVSEDKSLAIRITNEEFSNRLCNTFGKALVSTSSNISGEPTPSNFSEISFEIIEKVDYVVNYNQESLTKPAPSRILLIQKDSTIKVIRN